MKRFLCALLLAATLLDAVGDGAKTANARVTLVYQHELPNVPGKSIKRVRFDALAAAVERMERTPLDRLQQLDFAADAFALRFPKDLHGGLQPSQLLVPRRAEDAGNDLWRTFNVVQENILRGGLVRRSASNRLTRTRRITAIREDVRLNSGLWDLAIARAA